MENCPLLGDSGHIVLRISLRPGSGQAKERIEYLEALSIRSEALNKLVLSAVEWIQTSNDKKQDRTSRPHNVYATGLSNCPKLSDNPRIKTVEYTVAG